MANFIIKETNHSFVLYDSLYGLKYKYKKVKSILDVPLGYVVWNIGRRNFPIYEYIPMGKATSDMMDLKSLVAVPVRKEKFALKLIQKASEGTVQADQVRDYLKQEGELL